jgi:hypothetical protein
MYKSTAPPKFLKEKVSKALSSLAIKAAPDENVAEKMTEDIPLKMYHDAVLDAVSLIAF